MIRNRIAKGIKIALMGIMAMALFGFVVMGLWNWLMPAIFGLRTVGYWQALGLVVLSKILFGSFHSHGNGRPHWGRRMQARWERMTPEEREKFQRAMWGPYCAPGPVEEPKP